MGRADGKNRNQGTAAIELALAAPMLLILLTGIVEIGMAGYQAMQVQAAVEAGMLYAATNSGASMTAIGNAVVAATGTPGITAAPAPLAFCGCPTSAGVVSQGTNCTKACPDATAPGHYVQVSAQIAHDTIMPFITLPLPAIITASTAVRVQ